MFKQATKGITIFLLVILLIPISGYSECGNNSKKVNSSNLNISDLSTDELYQLYVENVEMNNIYLHQMNHLGHKNGLNNAGMYLVEFNIQDIELVEKAQEESYKLFKEWVKDEELRKEFIAKMNEHHSKNYYQLVNNNLK